MEPGKTADGGGVGDSSSSLRATTSLKKQGDRQVFTVELHPGETTTVSWKRLMKDANKVNGSSNPLPDTPPISNPNLDSRISPGQPSENEANDEPTSNRFSAVIEKIERLYMGKDSSDDEELDDIPDDDQYDTEDSFIDDEELDEYFEVDNSAIKHNGFFVNRGKLERINETTMIPDQQPKKRRRKDTTKTDGESDDGPKNKYIKANKTTVGKTTPLLGNNSSAPSQNVLLRSEHSEDLKSQNQLNAGISSKKKYADTKSTSDPSFLKVTNGDGSLSLLQAKDIEKLQTGVGPSKNLSNKMKDASFPSDASHHKSHDNSASHAKSHHVKTSNNVDEVRMREKNGVRELPDLNISDSKCTVQTTKTSHMQKRDGSNVRPKISVLEKAMRELEKAVAESRPPAVENQEVDTSSQAVKRRLPREVKGKLAKVARVEHAIHGKITKELLNRLDGILGHLIQLRSLKRNLKIMVTMGLSAKQEKDDRFQQIKKEVVEMIGNRTPSLESKAFEQQVGDLDDFQETGLEEKGAPKRKFSMDAVMEEKICDLYDLYVDGLDEDAGPQIRKLYAELAELWPNGFMDNHGIKHAICRAKERRRALYSRHKDQEKMKRRKMLAETVRVEAGSIAQPQFTRERLATDSGGPGLTSANKPNLNTTGAVLIPSPINGPSTDRLKQEKLKGGSSNSVDDARMVDGALTKKKVKRKPEPELGGTHIRPDNLPAHQGKERHKSLKHASGLPQKSNLHSTAPPSFDQSS
ncbi:HRD domain-containing protein [Cephalotus follicularis]|uniref:HRD domain-containing protein n=1 Tax=Cephalotus follicularis TaxID=3775 RepID=A0A1Q3C0Y2_CEPFO|nr:HRD domain-containing protein [Cephalotus follicularis]